MRGLPDAANIRACAAPRRHRSARWNPVPTARWPPSAVYATAGKIPSPRFASVRGHRPTVAPHRARADVSAGVMWVAWTRHHRRSTGAFASSHSTGRAPVAARQSATSLVCSAAWMCTGRLRGQREQVFQLGRSHRAEAVRGDPHVRPGQRGRRLIRAFEQPREPVERVDEAPLPGDRRLPAEAPVRVEGRQQRQVDFRDRRRAADPFGQLPRIAVRRSIAVVVNIMELPHAGETRLQHFHEGHGRDGFHVLRRDAVQKHVHRLAPGPEAVGGGPAYLGETRHAALKGVAVDVGEARDAHRATLVVRARGDAPYDGRDEAPGDGNADGVHPFASEKSRLEPQRAGGARGAAAVFVRNIHAPRL